MRDEGYIKYQCIWKNSPIKIPVPAFNSLCVWREKLYNISLIGAYKDGIGYGNISVRNNETTFYITGSATGGKKILGQDDFALVYEWQFDKNQLSCLGKTKASSESLTHAAIYESDPEIKSVIHVHSEKMWNHYLKKVPSTSADIEFGTPEMAFALKRLLENKKNITQGIVLMEGHREGILTFGKDINEAGARLLKYYHQPLNSSTISESGCK